MLLGNYSVLQKSPLKFSAGSTTSAEVGVRSNWGKSGSNRNRFYIDMATTALAKYAVPTGYYPPATWIIPQVAGELGSGQVLGAGSATAGLAGGVNGLANLTGSGDITTAIGQLVISMAANLTGAGTISSTDLKAYLNATANLTGGGTLGSTLAALAWAQAAIAGGGTITSATPYATGQLDANIRGYSDLTPEGIRDKVWAAILESGMSAAEVQRILLAFAAGNATGLEGANPAFKSQDGSKNRITATYATGTRTVTAIDGA